jgi:hypothetical protein
MYILIKSKHEPLFQFLCVLNNNNKINKKILKQTYEKSELIISEMNTILREVKK